MNPDLAETVALQALSWVLGHDDLRGVFLGSTGAGSFGGEISPEVLVAVLDFLCLDDAWVIAFCDAEGHDYGVPLAARGLLPGGTLPEWT